MAYQVIFWAAFLAFCCVIPSTYPFIWSSQTPAQTVKSQPSITISIGNHYNTQSGMNEAGTNITGLTITLGRWFGRVGGNGNQIAVSSPGNGSTVIRVGYNHSPTVIFEEDPAPGINNTIPSRRKRETGFIPTLPISPSPFIPSVPPPPPVPIPTMDSNFIRIDGKLVRLPDSVTNLTGNATPATPTEPMKQPWQFLQTLIERRPSKVLDPLVDFLASKYLSTGKVMTERSLATLKATEDFFYGIANNSLNYVTDQVSTGLQGVTRSFNELTQMRRTCVGGIPEDAGGRLVQRTTGCVQERLDEVMGIVDEFRSNVEASEGLFSGWLIEMSKSSAGNFPDLVDDAELDDAQRECYSKAIVSPSGKLIDIPLRWAHLAMRTNTAVQTFQAQIGLCVAKVGLEVAAISGEFGAKITQCTLRLSSPKLPQPIFLPTRKFGPTIRTPDDELTEWRAEYILLPPPRVVPPPPPPPPPPAVVDVPAPGTPLQKRREKILG